MKGLSYSFLRAICALVIGLVLVMPDCGNSIYQNMQHGGADFSIRGAHFMEHMVEAGKAVTDFFGKRIAYVNVMRRMSVRCDCAGPDAEEPTIGDIGMVASTDLLAIDQACVDMVYDKPGGDNKDLIERIESREGLRQLSYMKELKMGNPNYELISID